MAIAFVSSGIGSGTSDSVNAGGPTNGALVVFVGVNSKTGTCSVTYGGNAMTSVTSLQNSGSSAIKLFGFFLAPVPAGSNTLAITASPSLSYYSWASYSNVRPVVDTSGGNSIASGTSISNSVTTTGTADWIVACPFSPSSPSQSPGTNYADRSNNSVGMAIGDTNGSVSAGSNSQTVNWSSNQANGAILLQIAIATPVANTSSLTDNIMNGASRSVTVGRVQVLARSVSVSIMNGASRYVTFVKGKVINLTDNIMNGAGRYTLITLGKFWKRQAKNISSWTDNTKDSSSFTNQSKDSSSWTNQTKNL